MLIALLCRLVAAAEQIGSCPERCGTHTRTHAQLTDTTQQPPTVEHNSRSSRHVITHSVGSEQPLTLSSSQPHETVQFASYFPNSQVDIAHPSMSRSP